MIEKLRKKCNKRGGRDDKRKEKRKGEDREDEGNGRKGGDKDGKGGQINNNDRKTKKMTMMTMTGIAGGHRQQMIMTSMTTRGRQWTIAGNCSMQSKKRRGRALARATGGWHAFTWLYLFIEIEIILSTLLSL